MPKCLNCGCLTLWLPEDEVFKEAPQEFRTTGYYSPGSHRGVSYLARCFVRAHDLTHEIATRRNQNQDTETLALLKTINADRNCQSFAPWLQGFTPKEHQEMKYQTELRSQQQTHENRTLLVALIAAGISVVGIFVGALINLDAAKIEAASTRESAQKQIEALDRQTAEQIKSQRELAQMQIEAQKSMPSAPRIQKERDRRPVSTPNQKPDH